MGFMFNEGALQLLNSGINWGAGTMRARLVLSSQTPDNTAAVMTGIGITGNDQTLGSKTGPTKDDILDRSVYDAANPTFTAQPAGAAVNKMVIFEFNTNDADSVPITSIDIQERTPNGGDIGVTFHVDGAFYLNNQPV